MSSAFAGTVITGLSLNVAGDNTVTVNNSGTSAFPGGVGPAGNFPYINGWGWVSGSILWDDTNGTDTLRLDDSGIDVLNAGGIANANGSKTGSVLLSGDAALGAALRASLGVGNGLAFTSTISQSGSVDFDVTGTVSIAQIPVDVDLSVTKDDGVTTAVPGSQVTYTIVASNAGPDDENSAALDDTFPASLTCSWTSVAAGGASGNTSSSGNLADTLVLPSGGSVTYTVTCDIDPGATGSLVNTVTISTANNDTDPSNNSQTDTDSLTAESNLSIAKVGTPDPVIAGTNLTYTITVDNAGPSDAAATTVVDTLPAGTTYVSDTASIGCTPDTPVAGDVSCLVGIIAAGGSPSFDIVVAVGADVPDGTVLSNEATVSSDSQDPDDTNNTVVGVETTVNRDSDLSIAKADTPDPVIAGAELTYTITVDNAGPSDAAVTTVVDTLPAGTTYVSDTAGFGCTPDTPVAGDVSCLVGIIAAGGSPSFDLVVAVDPGVPHGTTITNVATVSSSSFDPVLADNIVSEDTLVNREATFDITKIWGDEGAGEVEVTLTCSSGAVTSPTSTPASMTVTGFGDGTICSVTEAVPAGYAPSYSADCNVAGVLSNSVYSCEITNATTTARFQVTKDFSDGSTDDVEVTLTCNTGLPLEQSLTIAGGDPFGVIFVVTEYIDGTMSCSVTEVTNTPGYDMDTSGCVWDNVMTADSPFSCVVNNTARDGTFTVNKVWNIFNEETGSEVIEQAHVEIWCDAEITNGGSYDEFFENWYLSDYLGDGDSLTATVSTLTGTANCWANEQIFESGVESTGDCGSRPIVAGGSSSCTFTNTVFFEGIPTLSQYGLALLALLMLGVGMVGFRRFA